MNDGTGKIHDKHRERMRRRYIETGLAGYTEHQIVEMLLFYAVPRVDTNETAHILTDRFGSAAEVIAAEPGELRKVLGSGKRTERIILLFSLISGIYPRCFGNMNGIGKYCAPSGPPALSADALKVLFRSFLRAEPDECFAVALFFADSPSPFFMKVVSRGKDIFDRIDIRFLIKLILEKQAYAIAAAHGIPDEIPVPTELDTYFAEKLSRLFDSAGVVFADYLIAAERSVLSVRTDCSDTVFMK